MSEQDPPPDRDKTSPQTNLSSDLPPGFAEVLHSALSAAFKDAPYTMSDAEKQTITVKVLENLDLSTNPTAETDRVYTHVYELAEAAIANNADLPQDIRRILQSYFSPGHLQTMLDATDQSREAIIHSVRGFSATPFEILNIEITSEHIAYTLKPPSPEQLHNIIVTKWQWYDLRWSENPHDDTLDHEVELRVQSPTTSGIETVYVTLRGEAITSIATHPRTYPEKVSSSELQREDVSPLPNETRRGLELLIQETLAELQ